MFRPSAQIVSIKYLFYLILTSWVCEGDIIKLHIAAETVEREGVSLCQRHARLQLHVFPYTPTSAQPSHHLT